MHLGISSGPDFWRLATPHAHQSRHLNSTITHSDQERRVIDEIEAYFKHPIPEVPYDNEEEFVNVLRRAGLTEQEA